jgi:hypothetical protein
MIRLLFIEDEKSSVAPVILHLNGDKPFDDCKACGIIHLRSGPVSYDCKVSGFTTAQGDLQELQPHIVILDIVDAGMTGNAQPAGNSILDFVWKDHFCPVLVYSAHLDQLAVGEWSNHPFVKIVQKGSGSEKKLEEILMHFNPHITAIRDSERFMRNAFASVMRDVAPFAFSAYTNEDQRKKVILRSGRRRVAAMMDETRLGDKLASWECYIHPPVSNNLTLGDILMLKSGTTTDPSAFRVVLTPSCDLVKDEKREAKVKEALVAKCIPAKEGVDEIKEGCQLQANKLLEKLPTLVLSQGFYQRFIPFPELKEKIPPMMADLKKLELIPLEHILPEPDNKYSRVASLDSPFRELVSWAYMQTACRLGLPDRDFKAWGREITDAYNT